jgi:hypothetical protein
MNYGDIRDQIVLIINKLDSIDKHTDNNACCVAVTSAGQNSSVPAGFRNVSVIQTGAGVVVITMSDGSTFTLNTVGQSYVVSAPIFKNLPAFTVATTDGATWQWSALS